MSTTTNTMNHSYKQQAPPYSSPPLAHQHESRGRSSNIDQSDNNSYGYYQQIYRSEPLLYPLKDGNFDILYSEEGDGEILVETLPPKDGGHLRLITCVDISTLYKEKRNKAIDIAKEYSKLQHRNLLCVTSNFDLLDNNGTLLFYTESPDHIAGWKSYCKKKFTTDEMLCIFRQLCLALTYVHDQGLIHRDVHPTRIHSSFGLAKFNLIGMPYNYKKLLKKDNFCGHVNYSAPELIQERQSFSSKVDVWSLGCCLYYLCTKKDPFEGRNPQEIKQNIMFGRLEKYPTKFDPVLKTLINKCLEKDEYKRLSACEMIEFQNKIESEAYGEIRSQVMLNQIVAEYEAIRKNPMIHQSHGGSDSEQDIPKSSAYYGIKYKNAHFFGSHRFPYQSLQSEGQEDPSKASANIDTSLSCRSPQSNQRDHSEQYSTHHSLNHYYANNSLAPTQDRNNYYSRLGSTGDFYVETQSETSLSSNYKDQRQAFQQNYRNYKYESGDPNISQFARSSIKQNFQNNFNQDYQKQQFNHSNTRVVTAQEGGGQQYVLNNTYKVKNQQSGFQDQAYQKTSQEDDQTKSGKIPQQFCVYQTNPQPTKSSQPHQIILPKQEQIQRQIKQQQDLVDPPLPVFNSAVAKSIPNQQQKEVQESAGLKRFNLTETNLDRFNSQREQQRMTQTQENTTQARPTNQQSKDEQVVTQPLQNDSKSLEVKVSAEDESGGGAMPYSIFNNECIFATQDENNERSSIGEFNSDIIKDVILQQEDPSSGESRNELNKDEIEGIVAQIVESSKRVKNQVHFQDGTKYVGEVLRHGRGIYYDQNGSIYDGDWQDDLKYGQGKMLFQDGSVYDGHWENDKIHGKGVYLSSNGDRYEGYFNQGMKDGYGTIYFRNGNTYQGQWRNDQLGGDGVFHFKNGNYYEGSFVNGNFEGQGLMFFVGIGTYKGSFSCGNLEGVGRFDYLNGAIYDGQWHENKKHGRGKFIEADCMYNGEWENDIKHGRGTFLQKGSYSVEGVWNKGSLVEMTKFQNYI